MRNLLLSLVLLSTAALAAAGCGSEQTASSATALVPAGALMYGELTLDPEGGQEEAVNAIVSRFPGEGDAGERIGRLIEQGLRDSDAPIGFQDDIQPWLGDQAAFFLTGSRSPEGAALVATEDEEAARDALERSFEEEPETRSHEDVEYFVHERMAAGVLDGYLVLGTERGLRAVIDTSAGDQTLEDDEQFGEAVGELTDERLGLFWSRGGGELLAGMPAGELPGEFRALLEAQFTAVLRAEQDGVVFEGDIPAGVVDASPLFGRGSDLIDELPADSWLAMAQPDFGRLVDLYVGLFAGIAGGRDAIERQFEAATGLDLQRDVLGWMGDFAIFVRGASVRQLEGALIVETTDEQASGRLIARLRELADDQLPPSDQIAPLTIRGEGFTITSPELPRPFHLVQRDGRVVIALGDQAAADAFDPVERLGESAEYTDATESLAEHDISFYVAVQPLLELVDSTGAAAEADWQDIRRYLEPIDAFVAGVAGEGEEVRSTSKVVVK